MDKKTLNALDTLLHRVGQLEDGDVYMINELAEEAQTRNAFKKVAEWLHAQQDNCICD
jgi:hypothetical protein